MIAIWIIIGVFTALVLYGKISNMIFRKKHPEQYAELEEERKKYMKREMYNGYKDTCPNCGSHLVRGYMSSAKMMTRTVLGGMGDDLTAQHICDDCGHKW